MAIVRFVGPWACFSNFSDYPVSFCGVIYPTVEHAFQAAKTLNRADRVRIQAAPTPGAAKRIGRTVVLRPDWDQLKYGIMYELLLDKFMNHTSLFGFLPRVLDHTGKEVLIEGNTWNDRIWGMTVQDNRDPYRFCGTDADYIPGEPFGYNGSLYVGQNWLGRLLMQVREELRSNGN